MAADIDWDALEELASEQLQDPAFSALSQVYVPGEGDNPRVMIIGEAPGAHETMWRRPFVGPAGDVLRQLMALAGLNTHLVDAGDPFNSTWIEPNCWLTNTIKFRTPGNRKPTDDEIMASRLYIRRERIAVGSPKVIVLVGGTALHMATGRPQSILRAAGKLHKVKSNYDRSNLFVWPMVHPSFAMQNPIIQPVIEQDWERLGAWLAENP